MVNEFNMGDNITISGRRGSVIGFGQHDNWPLVMFETGSTAFCNPELMSLQQDEPVNEFKVGDKVAHTKCGNGTVIPGGMDMLGMYHVNVELENGDTRMCLPVNLRPRNFLSKIAEEQNRPYTSYGEIKGRFKKVDDKKGYQIVICTDLDGKSIPCAFSSWVLFLRAEMFFGKMVIARGMMEYVGSSMDPIYASVDEIDPAPEDFVPVKADDILGVLPEAKTFDQQFNEVFNPERFQRNAYGQLVDTVTGLEADSDGIVKISSIKDTIRSMGR